MKIRNSLVLMLAFILAFCMLFTGCQKTAVDNSTEVDENADGVAVEDVEEYAYSFWDYLFGRVSSSKNTQKATTATQKATQKATTATQKATTATQKATTASLGSIVIMCLGQTFVQAPQPIQALEST